MQNSFVYICSAGHSGSTLLDLLLGAHHRGLALGEITQLPKNIALDSQCSCRSAVSQCAFWKPLIDEFSRQNEIDLWSNPYALNLGFIKAGNEIDHSHQTASRMLLRRVVYGLEFARLDRQHMKPRGLLSHSQQTKIKLFDFLLGQLNKRFVVDSSKHYLGAINLYGAAPARTRVIHLVRDGRAVFSSGLARGLSKDDALTSWSRPVRRAEKLLRRHLPDNQFIKVHYEHLAASPGSELRRISDFIGVEFEPGMLDFTARRSHILNGNRMRFAETSEIRLDQKWKSRLDEAQLQYFESQAGDLNRSLGYA